MRDDAIEIIPAPHAEAVAQVAADDAAAVAARCSEAASGSLPSPDGAGRCSTGGPLHPETHPC